MTKNMFYETPTTKILVVRFEGVLMQSGNPNSVRSNSASSGYDSDFDLGEI